MSWLAPALGLVGSLFGSIQQQNQSKAMQAFLNQLYNQEQGIDSKVESGVNALNNEAGMYESVLPGLSSAMGALANGAGAQAPGAALSYITNAMSPQALAALTGVNASGLTSAATKYLSNPGATNLAGVTPGTNAFYANEMANGLNPQTQINAQNQLQQQFQSANNALRANLAPGQNPSAMQQALQNQLLSSSTNLGSQLAGENQQVMAQGAQGITNNASALDAQKAAMLTGAAQLGTNYNQTVLGDQAAGASFGQQLLNALQNFAGQGNQLQEFGTSALAALGSQLAQQSEAFTGMGESAAANAAQNNPFSSLGSILAQYPNLFGGGSSMQSPASLAAPYIDNFFASGAADTTRPTYSNTLALPLPSSMLPFAPSAS